MKREWRGFAASVRGPGHVRWGVPNQDAWRFVGTSWGDVLVVSDGMGSYAHAREGACACCRAVVAAAGLWAQVPEVEPDTFLALLHHFWLFLVQPHAPEECHCTCLLAVRRNDDFFLAQLGDGLVCVCGAEETGLPFGLPEKDFGTATDGLGRHFSPKLWKWTVIPAREVSGIILATDGVADDLENEYVGVFVRDIINAARTDGPESVEKDLTTILNDWPVAGHSDDKTIAGIFSGGLDA